MRSTVRRRFGNSRAALMFGALTLVVAGAGAALVPSGASADPGCIAKTFSVYPGSGIAALRYGRADFTFQLCAGDPSGSFKTNASVVTNATGQNLGITFDTPQIVASSLSPHGGIYRASFHSQSCLPRITWPCRGSGDWTVKYAVSSLKQINPRDTVPDASVVELSRSTPDFDLALYDTP